MFVCWSVLMWKCPSVYLCTLNYFKTFQFQLHWLIQKCNCLHLNISLDMSLTLINLKRTIDGIVKRWGIPTLCASCLYVSVVDLGINLASFFPLQPTNSDQLHLPKPGWCGMVRKMKQSAWQPWCEGVSVFPKGPAPSCGRLLWVWATAGHWDRGWQVGRRSLARGAPWGLLWFSLKLWVSVRISADRGVM